MKSLKNLTTALSNNILTPILIILIRVGITHYNTISLWLQINPPIVLTLLVSQSLLPSFTKKGWHATCLLQFAGGEFDNILERKFRDYVELSGAFLHFVMAKEGLQKFELDHIMDFDPTEACVVKDLLTVADAMLNEASSRMYEVSVNLAIYGDQLITFCFYDCAEAKCPMIYEEIRKVLKADGSGLLELPRETLFQQIDKVVNLVPQDLDPHHCLTMVHRNLIDSKKHFDQIMSEF